MVNVHGNSVTCLKRFNDLGTNSTFSDLFSISADLAYLLLSTKVQKGKLGCSVAQLRICARTATSTTAVLVLGRWPVAQATSGCWCQQ